MMPASALGEPGTRLFRRVAPGFSAKIDAASNDSKQDFADAATKCCLELAGSVLG
jgi:hypothetical protein